MEEWTADDLGIDAAFRRILHDIWQILGKIAKAN
jgi:hypothetical protein